MNNKALKTLEYTKIIEMLAAHASSPLGKIRCEDLLPSCSPGEIEYKQEQTQDALSRLFQKGNINFGSAKDIRGSLKRDGCHRTGGHPLGDGGNLCDLPDPSSENKMEPGTCDGTGRSAEAADGDCGDRIKGFSFPENCGILEHRKYKGEHLWNFG